MYLWAKKSQVKFLILPEGHWKPPQGPWYAGSRSVKRKESTDTQMMTRFSEAEAGKANLRVPFFLFSKSTGEAVTSYARPDMLPATHIVWSGLSPAYTHRKVQPQTANHMSGYGAGVFTQSVPFSPRSSPLLSRLQLFARPFPATHSSESLPASLPLRLFSSSQLPQTWSWRCYLTNYSLHSTHIHV